MYSNSYSLLNPVLCASIIYMCVCIANTYRYIFIYIMHNPYRVLFIKRPITDRFAAELSDSHAPIL